MFGLAREWLHVAFSLWSVLQSSVPRDPSLKMISGNTDSNFLSRRATETCKFEAVQGGRAGE